MAIREFFGFGRGPGRGQRRLTMSSTLLEGPTSAELEKGIGRFSGLRLPRVIGSRRVLFTLLAAGCCIYLLAGVPHSGSRSKTSRDGRSLFGKRGEYCTAADFEEGYWVEGPIITTEKQAMEVYGYSSIMRSECYTGDRENKDSSVERALEIASPKFTLRRDCKMRRLRYRQALIRLLRMPSGLFLIGDSLTKNAEEVFENLLIGPGSPVLLVQGNLHSIPMWRNLTLKADHATIPDLLAEAGVSRERLDFPLVTFLRADHLLPERELSPIISSFTDNHHFSVPSFIEHYDWFKEMTDRLTEASDTVVYAEGVKAEHSVVALNTGPHWNVGELGARMTDGELNEAYRRVSLVVAEKLETIPQKLDVFWRAIAPGHTECERYTTANNSAISAEPPGEPDNIWYNYDQFPIWNNILREHFPTDPPPKPWWSSQPSTPHNWPRFLDIWDMSVKRGDAHFGPGWDCLHWCPMGVPDAWASMMWNLIPLQNPEKLDDR